MIESTAVFFGFLFLAFVVRGVSEWCKQAQFRWVWLWLLLGLFCGILCALVKATTFPSFGVAAVLAAFALLADRNLKLPLQQKGICLMVVVWLWGLA